MQDTDKKAYNKIHILVSFLDEENMDIIKNVKKELLLINQEENNILKEFLNDIDNPIILKMISEIVSDNNLRYQEDALNSFLKKEGISYYDLMVLLAGFTEKNLNTKKLKQHYEKILRDIWALMSPEITGLDASELLKSFFTQTLKIRQIPDKNLSLKHLLINEVLINKEGSAFFINLFYLSVAQDLNIPILPVKINELMFLGFENKGPYALKLIDNRFLFYIDNKTLSPYPETRIYQKFNLDPNKDIPYYLVSPAEIVVTIFNRTGKLYLRERKLNTAKKYFDMAKRISTEFDIESI